MALTYTTCSAWQRESGGGETVFRVDADEDGTPAMKSGRELEEEKKTASLPDAIRTPQTHNDEKKEECVQYDNVSVTEEPSTRLFIFDLPVSPHLEKASQDALYVVFRANTWKCASPGTLCSDGGLANLRGRVVVEPLRERKRGGSVGEKRGW